MEIDHPPSTTVAASALSNPNNPNFKPANLDVASLLKTTHNERIYLAIQNLKGAVNTLVDHELAHPPLSPSSSSSSSSSSSDAAELAKREKEVMALLAVVKTLYRGSLVRVRKEKNETAKGKEVCDGLILGLENLRYEEASLRREIGGADGFDHKYTKLPLIPVDEFLALFPEHASSGEHELMIARIEHEHQDRVKLEDHRQEKLKEKQKLISEVKKSKENLTNLDSMVDRIEEAMRPIREVLRGDEFMRKRKIFAVLGPEIEISSLREVEEVEVGAEFGDESVDEEIGEIFDENEVRGADITFEEGQTMYFEALEWRE